MSVLSTTEDAIVAAIKSVITDAQIDAYPDDPEFFKPHKNNVILVSFEGTSQIANENGRGTRQLDEELWRVTYSYKNRRTHTGVYTAMESVRGALAGLKLNDMFMSLQSRLFVQYSEENSRWQYREIYNLPYRYEE